MDPQFIKELVEIGLDRSLDVFDLQHNLYVDLGMDSMGAVAMFVELQRRTRIEIDAEEAPRLQTGQELLDYIRARLREQLTYATGK